jgi:hypothetical protein
VDYHPYDEVAQRAALIGMEGGQSLIERLGYVPSFHDFVVRELRLVTDLPSSLSLSIVRANPTLEERIRFTIAEIVDLEIEFFGGVNILYDLRLYPAPDRPDRRAWYAREASRSDVEFDFSPTAGLAGTMRFRGIAVAMETASAPASRSA